MSTRFVTVTDAYSEHFPVLVWEERPGSTPRVVSRHSDPYQVENGDAMEWHRFVEPTTLKVRADVNKATQPVVDADGAPLWKGARIAFCIQSHYINTVSGTGSFETVSQYGGSTIVCDEALPLYLDRGGSYRERSQVQHVAMNDYVRKGELEGFRRLSSKLGDRFEHGQTDVFIRLADDPRKVCEPIPNPNSAPRP